MQAIMESIFDICYLVLVVSIGAFMIVKGRKNKQYLLFGIMAVTLGLGDSFHLIPRVIALNSTNFDDYIEVLGIGKLITSITMTAFYVLLYYVWRVRYDIKGKQNLTISIILLSIIRIILCVFPQNDWLVKNPSVSWGVYRNIPFALIGLIIIIIFYNSAKKFGDKHFKWMWLTIVLSFAFYIPVVLFVNKVPMLGLLMIPKTCAYIWTVLIGYFDMKKELKLYQK